ncbi:MAG: aldolase/citrate lyase family protein [candidate division NC10 bacterium]|nr:aldolase/citrate lyase family protein [candidate division NC10 bacterium]
MDDRALSEVVTAFGGDMAQAETDVAERWEAMKRVDPAATREAATRQLAWEYAPRPIEHVFPGDNWYFMTKAAQSQAHILLLDLEDAVATTRKHVARTVLTLLVRAHRGLPLTEEELEFLKANALPAGKAEQLEQQFIREGAHFVIKPECRFPKEQMVLIRPNNLRTKWAAGDYIEVVREIGDLIGGIYLPKIEGPDDVRVAVQILRALQQERGWVTGRHRVFVLTELPGAILTAEEILAVAPDVEEANLGVVDYTAATGGRSVVQQEQYTYMRYPLLKLVEASRATGKAAGTGITVKLNADDTEVDTVRAIALGIHRKWSVHPAHVEGIARRAAEFPPIPRKRIAFPEISPFNLEQLKRLAQEEKPILPPLVFVPRPVTLCRSVVTVAGHDLDGLRAVLASPADMVIIDVEGISGSNGQEPQRKLAQLCREAVRPAQVLALQMDLGRSEAVTELQQLLQLFKERVQALILPAVDHPRAVRHAAGLLTGSEREVGLPVGSISLGARISQPEIIEREAYAVATASRRMMWILLDLKGVQPKEDLDDPKTKGYYYYRSALVAATAAADIDAVDAMSDAAHLEEETLFSANLGFHGKIVTPDQVERVNTVMNPPRAGEQPVQPKGPGGEAFRARWINSVERALEILELYATADQERNLGAVAYNDPVTGQPELVDAATARIYYRQLERALKAGQLTDTEPERYVTARDRLLLALRPGGMEQVGEAVFPGEKLQGDAVSVSAWMVQAFAKTSGDRNRYHLDRAYAEKSRFQRLVAHGLFTLSSMLAGLGRVVPAYGLESLEAHFRAPVYFGDTIIPLAEVQEVFEGGWAALRLSAVNQEGKVVCEGTATLRPEKSGDLLSVSPDELPWVRQWAQDVTPSVPSVVYDFTNPSSPRQQSFTKAIDVELVKATRALFGPLYPHQVSTLLALGTMAMTSAESSPGHLLLTVRVSHFGLPIEAGDQLSLSATAPPPDQIRRSQKGKGTPIVPIDIAVNNQRGGDVLKGQVVKLMEEQQPAS